jgi:hypothetical protein
MTEQVEKASDKAAEWMDLKALKPWERNPRKNADAIQKVADSIRRFGFGAPIVARRENGEIIAGHTRFRAAKLLGLKRVPVRLLDVSESDAHLLALADNKLGEIAEWDDQAVAELLSTSSFVDASLAGWDFNELGKLAESMIGGQDSNGDASEKLGNNLSYSVIVECADEDAQTALLERLEAEGLTCKPLVS